MVKLYKLTNFIGSNMIKNHNSLLTDGEQIILNARIHWFAFAFSAVLLLVALLAAAFFHWLVGIIILVLCIYPVYNAVIHYWMTHLFITNKKVMYRNGFLSRDWVQLRLSRVENAHLEEPIVGRFLGYSTVIISGTGAGRIAVPYVKGGDQYTKLLEKELERKEPV